MYRHNILFRFLIIIFFLVGCDKDMVISDCDFLDQSVFVDSLKVNNKVLIIGIDGFRSDAMSKEITPFIYKLLSERNVYENLSHSTEEDTYSGPNWSSILTGVHYSKHNVLDNSFNGSRFDTYPPFLRYIESNIDSINTVSIVNWAPINEYILSDYVDYYSDGYINDSVVFHKAMDLLIHHNPIRADILFLHFDELDAAGHSFGFSSIIQEYRETLSILDSYVDSLISIIDAKRLSGEDWLCLLISDHGGDGTGHGDYNNPKISKTVFMAEHPHLNFRQDHISDQTDIGPTILDYIGLSSIQFDCKKDGVSIIE